MNEFLAVGNGARSEGETPADLLFVFRVYVPGFPDIYRDGHGGVRQSQRARLGLAQLGPGTILRFRFSFHEIGQLHEEERKWLVHARRQSSIIAWNSRRYS